VKLQVSGNLEFIIADEGIPRLIFSVKTQNNVSAKDITMLVLPIDQKVHCSIEPVDAKGNPAAIDGVPTWTSSNEQIATAIADPVDGSGIFTAWVTPVGQLGTCQINVTADADLGSGITTITGVMDLQAVAGQAVGFEISHDAPVPQAASKAAKK
jgi:hypothetical protein